MGFQETPKVWMTQLYLVLWQRVRSPETLQPLVAKLPGSFTLPRASTLPVPFILLRLQAEHPSCALQLRHVSWSWAPCLNFNIFKTVFNKMFILKPLLTNPSTTNIDISTFVSNIKNFIAHTSFPEGRYFSFQPALLPIISCIYHYDVLVRQKSRTIPMLQGMNRQQAC